MSERAPVPSTAPPDLRDVRRTVRASVVGTISSAVATTVNGPLAIEMPAGVVLRRAVPHDRVAGPGRPAESVSTGEPRG